MSKAPILKCSFCGKDNSQVIKMITNNNVCICDECVDICSDTVHGIGAKNHTTEPSFEVSEQLTYFAVLRNYDDRIIKKMLKWMDDNLEESWVRVYHEDDEAMTNYKIHFINESDIVAFKLRWI